MKEIGNMLFNNNCNEDYNYEIVNTYQFANIFEKLLDTMKFNSYGFAREYDENSKYLGDEILDKIYDIFTIDEDKRLYGIKNIFFLHPYNWNWDIDDKLPNFYYCPKDFGIQWYKYAMRDAYSNKEITLKEFNEIINNCVKEVNKIIPKWLKELKTSIF